MRCVRALACAVVIGAATAAWAQGTPPPGAGIVPGRGIGAFQLGEDISDAATALGPVHSEEPVGAALKVDYWPLRRIGTVADASSNKIVALVVALDDGYRTDKGIGAGAALDAVRSAYGAEDETDNGQDHNVMVYNKLGVAFAVDTSGPLADRVSEIYVFTPGQYDKIFRQSGGGPGTAPATSRPGA